MNDSQTISVMLAIQNDVGYEANVGIEARRRLDHLDVCPLCEEKIRPTNGLEVVMMISNQAGIPNRILHGDCFDKHTPEHALRFIAGSYEESLCYAHWFEL